MNQTYRTIRSARTSLSSPINLMQSREANKQIHPNKYHFISANSMKVEMMHDEPSHLSNHLPLIYLELTSLSIGLIACLEIDSLESTY